MTWRRHAEWIILAGVLLGLTIFVLWHLRRQTIRSRFWRSRFDVQHDSGVELLRRHPWLGRERFVERESLKDLAKGWLRGDLRFRRKEFGGTRDTGLNVAARWNAGELVPLLLEAGADANAKEEGDITPIHRFASHDAEQAVSLLIRAGADVKAKDQFGSTVLHWAASSGGSTVVTLLLRSGADVNARNGLGLTPLHWAARDNAAASQALLRAGADVNALDADDKTPLDRAESNEVRKLLRDAGAKTAAELRPEAVDD